MRIIRQRWLTSSFAVMAALAALTAGEPAAVAGSSHAPTTTAPSGPAWEPAWTSAMAWAPGQANDTTVRQVVPVGVSGTEIRVELANTFGTAPLPVGAASVALQSSGAATQSGTVRQLSFGGSPSAYVPAGGTLWSDPLSLTTTAGESVLVSAWVSGPAVVSAHYDSGPLSYANGDFGGDAVMQPAATGFALPATWGRWVTAVDVAGGLGPASATVVFGDSISDGFNSACGVSNICQDTVPWPTLLQQRVDQLPPDGQTAVVDESITANTVLSINTPLADRYRLGGGGPAGLDRIGPDLLDQAGVKRALLLLGTNDLWFGATTAQLIAGYRQFASAATADHMTVIASTLLPRADSEGWTAADEQERLAVNQWLLTSHTFPVVLDLAPVVADIYGGDCDPSRIYPPFDSGDHLHPNTAGQQAMANAIPARLVGASGAPTLPPLADAVPTPGCAHPPVLAVGADSPATTVPTTTGAAPTTRTATSTTIPSTTPRTAGGRSGRQAVATGPPRTGGTVARLADSGALSLTIAAAILLAGAAVIVWFGAWAHRSRYRRRRSLGRHRRRRH